MYKKKITEIAEWMIENNVTTISVDGSYVTFDAYDEDEDETLSDEFILSNNS